MEHEIKVSYYFTDDDLENIIVTALEGGIGYWACLDNTGEEWDEKPGGVATSEWAWKILKNHGQLHFIDEEDDDADYFMDLASLFNGIRLCIQRKDWYGGRMEVLDAALADMIVQYAIFGTVIYG